MKDNKNNKAKIYMIFSLVVLVIAVIVSGTYAYYVWTTSDSDTTKIVAGIGAATVTFDGGSDISANLRPVSDKSKGIVKNISVKADTEGLVFNMYLDITSIDTGLKDESFRYELYKGDTKVKEGNFSDSYLTSNTVTCTKNNTNHIVLLTNESISTSKTSYTLYIWIDGANYTNPNTMMNKTFSFKLHADGEGAVMKGYTAADYITDLYTEAAKVTFTNNNITYNKAPSVSLMNDRLGGTTEDLDGGNIRYYGASPNNYIYFNCAAYPGIYYAWQTSNNPTNNPFTSEEECLNYVNTVYRNNINNITCSSDWENYGFESETACNEAKTEEKIKENVKNFQQEMCLEKVTIEEPTDCELWRIIGVFNGKLKIIRNESIGKYSWDNKDTSTGAEEDYGKNDWTTARLMKLLNPSNYYTIDSNDNGFGQSLYYNRASGKCYLGINNATVDCDFTSTGIKNDVAREMIQEVTWNLGGTDDYSDIYSNQTYIFERGTTVYNPERPTTWTGKIALAYLSDYGYAADLIECMNKQTGADLTMRYFNYKYNGEYICLNNNWLYKKDSMFFLLNPISSNSTNVEIISSSGTVSDGPSYNNAYAVYPTLFLNTNLKIIGGNGKSDNPYLISK